MPVKTFTDRWLKTLKTDKSQEEYTDSSFSEKGTLSVVVSRAGKKSFYHRYRANGKKKRDFLGSYPSLSLAVAREKAIENVSQINKGNDPVVAKRVYRESETFEDLAKLFFERSSEKLAVSTLKTYRKMYECDLEKCWGDRKACDIQKADVIEVLEHICYERKAPTKSNRTYELIRRIFNFGISRDIVSYNPVQGLEKLGQERHGERVFSREEITLFWKATKEQPQHIRAIFRLLLLTGQRPGEITAIEWSHIDHDILTIPAANSKNRRRHQVHLEKLALNELAAMREITGAKEFVFAIGQRSTPIQTLTKGHWGVMEQMEKLLSGTLPERLKRDKKAKSRGKPQLKETEEWSPRDIRRTVQTRMAESGIRPDVVDRVLNHNVTGVRRHYDHYSYYPEIRDALIKWENRLGDIFAGKDTNNVIDISLIRETRADFSASKGVA